MTDNHFYPHWPLSMPFSNYDPRSGEKALTDSRLFRSNDLRLLCGVRLCDLEYADGTCPMDKYHDRQLLDYLICKDDRVLLSIDMTDRDPSLGDRMTLKGLPTSETTGEQFETGDVAGILSLAEALLQGGEPSVWYCRLRPYPPELSGQLFEHRLLQPWGGDAAPTDFGMDLGLVRVLSPGRCSAMCTQWTAEKLPRVLGDRTFDTSAIGLALLDKRLTAFRSGLLCNGQSSARTVLEFMNTPLDEYMDGFPEELETLQDSLPGQCVTYGQAACASYGMLLSGDQAQLDEGTSLMCAIAVPPLEDRKIRNAVRFGRKATGRMPDNMPERYRRTADDGGDSFEARLSRFRNRLPSSMKLTFGTQESFFQGVSILAQSHYPLWLAHKLKTYLELSDRYVYAELLDIADTWRRRDNALEHDFGVRLLFLLLIEPFQLIFNQSQNDRNQQDTKGEAS